MPFGKDALDKERAVVDVPPTVVFNTPQLLEAAQTTKVDEPLLLFVKIFLQTEY